MKISYIYILFLLFCNYQSIQSQSDSVVLTVEQNLSSSKEFLQKNLDSAMYFTDEALRLSQQISNDTLIGKSFLYKSNVLISQKRLSEADSILRFSLDEKNLSPRTEGEIWYNLATIKHKQQRIEKALELYLKAVEIFERLEEWGMAANTYTYIAITSLKPKYFDKGLTYYKKALSLNDKDDILRLDILDKLAYLYKLKRSREDFLKTAREVERLSKKLGRKKYLPVIYQNLSSYYEEMGEYDHSIKYGKKGIALNKELNPNKNLSFSYYLLGANYVKNKEYKTAIKCLDSALLISGSDNLLRSEICDELRILYAKLNDYKTALYYADLKNEIKDSIAKEGEKEKAAELIEKFESEKKELEIASLTREKEVQKQITAQAKSLQNLYLLAAIFLFFLLGVSIWAFLRLRKQQKELALVNQVKNRLFSIIAHDLRGMIIPFQRMGKIMKHHIDKENYGRTIQLSQELEKNSERLSHTLDNLLNWSLEQMDGYKINPEQILLGKQLKEIIDNFEQHANYKNIHIDLRYKEDIPIQFDKGAFHVIFRNLLGNALKYTENGKIIIEFNKQIDTLECSVTDDGVGMSEEQLEDIFTLNKRQTTSGTQGESGTGLGLNLVYRFVKMHQGIIKISSKKTQGTRFDLSFPIK